MIGIKLKQSDLKELSTDNELIFNDCVVSEIIVRNIESLEGYDPKLKNKFLNW